MNNEKNVGVSPLKGLPYGKLGFIIKDGSVTIKKLAAEVLNLIYSSGGGGGEGIVGLIDISDRMLEDNDTITDFEIKTSLFLYNVYDRVAAIARVVEPKSNTRYALFKVCHYDDADDKNKIIYVAYTTEDDFTESATWHYSRVFESSDSLYPWAMSVFGDVVIDAENDLLIVGSSKYNLERHIEEPVISYFYNIPEITKFEYPVVSADGGVVYPLVKFKQTIVKTVDYGSRIDEQTLTLTGTMEYVQTDDNVKYGVTYSSKSLVVSEASAVFTGNNPYQSGGVDTVGAVTATASDRASVIDIRNVSVVLTLNGQSSESYQTVVKQSAAWIDSSKNVTSASAGGENIVTINKSTGVWVERSDVESNANWIVVNNAVIEDNQVTVKYTVAANNSVSPRTGTITIATDVAGLQSEITVTQAAAKAVISVDPKSVSFGQQYVDSSYTQQVTVYGTNIDGNVYVSNQKNTPFIVSPVSITAEQANASDGYKLTITYNPKTIGNHTGKFTLSSTGADDIVVNISGTGVRKPVESYTCYYGTEELDTDTPQIVESQKLTISEDSNTTSIKITDEGMKAWVAIPLSINSKVTVTAKDGQDIPFTPESTTIGDYVYYYRSALISFFNTEFTVVYNN